MSRFSGRVRDDLEANTTTVENVPEEIDVQAKAFLALTMYVNGVQRTVGRFLLVTDTESVTDQHGPAEVFKCVDGETGEAVQVTVSYPSRD